MIHSYGVRFPGTDVIVTAAAPVSQAGTDPIARASDLKEAEAEAEAEAEVGRGELFDQTVTLDLVQPF